MPRQARLDVPGALHHIMVQGINKSNIFDDEEDKAEFIERLGQNVSEGKCTVYAWALMSNHAHILFKSGRDGISTVMRKILTWYAQHYNRRCNRTGHLFENRYKSILCDEDNYFLALVRSIIGKAAHTWMNIQYILTQFGSTRKRAVAAYQRFVREGIEQTRPSAEEGLS